jgi:hypothetical protein
MTFNNIQPVAYKTGTTMQFVLTSLAFKPFETYCSNNNMVIYNTQGIVQTFWQQGNQINESNPNLCGAAEDIILIKSPAGFLPAKSSNTLNIGWAAPGINLLDGNYICEAPQLSIPNGAYDCGSKIFADYWSGGQGSNTIGTAFTNNGMNATAIYNPAKNLTGVCGRWQG